MNKLTLTAALFAALSLVLTGCPKKEEAPEPPPVGSNAPGKMDPATTASPEPGATLDVTAVTAALKAADPALESVTVAIDDKGIKLTGAVANNEIKKKATDAVTAIAGGKKIINQLLVK